MVKQKKATRKGFTVLLISLGVLLILAAIGNGIYLYIRNNSPLDMVDTTVEELDENNSFIPLVQPEATSILDLNNSPTQGGSSEVPKTTDDPLSTPTPEPGAVPDRIVIPVIKLDAPVVPIHFKVMHLNDQTYEQWLVPNEFAAGWHETSALLGTIGNTVFNGHHNVFGKVFKDLIRLESGDEIDVYSGEKVFRYIVDEKLLLPERFQTLEKRTENAQWIMPTQDERLTLVTCWPSDSNTHRVIIVAYPKK